MPFGREILHGYYVSYFWESIGESMIVTLGLLFPYGMSHLGNLRIWEMFFHELLLWRVTHFVWMIAWRLELHMGMKVLHIFSSVLIVAWGQSIFGRGGL